MALVTQAQHPAPWTVFDFGAGNACAIYDANDELVESVYDRPCDPRGLILAHRIVGAVNNTEMTQTQSSHTDPQGGTA